MEGRAATKWKACMRYAMLNLVSETLPHKRESPINNLFRVFPMAVFRFIYSPAISTVPEFTFKYAQSQADAGEMPNNIVNTVINHAPQKD
jgi:hypothetical protein